MRGDKNTQGHALFTMFLPEIDDPYTVSRLHSMIESLVIGTKATGYTLLPPSMGIWFDDGAFESERVHPIQIVAEDTPRTYDELKQFARTATVLLDQHWLFIFRVPARVNEPLGDWE